MRRQNVWLAIFTANERREERQVKKGLESRDKCFAFVVKEEKEPANWAAGLKQ